MFVGGVPKNDDLYITHIPRHLWRGIYIMYRTERLWQQGIEVTSCGIKSAPRRRFFKVAVQPGFLR